MVDRVFQQAIRKLRAYAEQGYGYAVEIDLSKYFDMLNHELLLNLLRKQIKDKRVINLIKKYLKSGVMENGVRQATEEGSPQGGTLSPLFSEHLTERVRSGDGKPRREGHPLCR
ncbi:reverse transcriptase domain-containing protein [Paenibacillus pabuli]|uniref:reverse transcriptase domain-containing protein n=1 Tax=Paenibacillus pabuli TaxID=1472 RepID=UPI001FFEFACA|nr:reverse transcriptase domain-containing protein [Paenibacillus pabuli]UPK41151.1 hypothetical protein KET34_17670 [Paenibacillus pabuli]